MKKSVILLIALVIFMPISFAYEEKIYIYGNSLIASKENNIQDINYYHQDYLSSNRVTTNNNGEITGKNTQEPYGSEHEEKGNKESLENNYKYTGKEKDSSLYYFGARYYEPSNGRFISVDPAFDASVSPYVYANDNPLKYVDRDGMEGTIPQIIVPNPYARTFDTREEMDNWQMTKMMSDPTLEASVIVNLFFGALTLAGFGSSSRNSMVQSQARRPPRSPSSYRNPSMGSVVSRSERIGEGVFGEVWRAENLVIKRSRDAKGWVGFEDSHNVFLNEFNILFKYGGRYEFLPKAYSIGMEGGKIYLVKEFVRGNLATDIAISLAEGEMLAEQLGRLARESGIQLYDLKLDNIVRTAGNEIYLIDFLSRPYSEKTRHMTISQINLNLVRYNQKDYERISQAYARGYGE